MQRRERRPHGIRTRKISVSVSEADIRVLRARARRVHRGNISAVVHDMVASLKREMAMDELVVLLGADRVSDEGLQSLRDEIAVAPTRRRKRRSAA